MSCADVRAEAQGTQTQAQGRTWSVGGTARRPVCLEQSE